MDIFYPMFCNVRFLPPLDYTLFLPKSLLHRLCVRKTDFVAKYSSIIFTRCCVVNRPVDPYWCQKNLSGLLPTPPEKHGKNCKTQLWDEKQNR